jgi:hypothetical protein
MHTIQLSPQLHNVVNLLKNLDSRKDVKSFFGEKFTSEMSLSTEESNAIMVAFNRQPNGRGKDPQKPKSYWG